MRRQAHFLEPKKKNKKKTSQFLGRTLRLEITMENLPVVNRTLLGQDPGAGVR